MARRPQRCIVNYEVHVEVSGLEGIADPEGRTIERALPALGFDGVRGVRVGKVIRFSLDAPDDSAARAEVEEMCKRLLANPVIEQAIVTVAAASGAT
jgi:phosphoribosylformylglycinamidine synthase PurS subunit